MGMIRWTVWVTVAWWLPLTIAQVTLSTADKTGKEEKIHKYNICNGLSNQLIFHATAIADAIQLQADVVEIPDYFILDGEQSSDEPVLPNSDNSVDFSVVFDADHFLQQIESMGIKPRLVKLKTKVACTALERLPNVDPATVRRVLAAFQPSQAMLKIIEPLRRRMHRNGQGICVHHRNGEDWIHHCQRWSSIADGIYRGNCLELPARGFVNSLEDRGLLIPNPTEQAKGKPFSESRWMYYCGDHAPPMELNYTYQVQVKDDFMTETEYRRLATIGKGRDLNALVDFYACSSLDHFIGNSVSTFSALQIALRDDHTFWYNSQSIPLAEMWATYHIPIVYTYTELSQSSGRHMLQVSILSVRKFMPDNPIHILYHGHNDTDFRNWLQSQAVVVHDHDPAWRAQIEVMRLNGDPQRSHLFMHAGNYFGTWQRIDIPLFLNTEYCLQLDADTVIVRRFTLADFGLDLTLGLAMSSEMDPIDEPANAGVTLMNIPRLRQTYHNFLQFVLSHVPTGAVFNNPFPSDQGAYMEFYKNDVRFLDRIFNFKPYWKESAIGGRQPMITHFHGAKPHDYIKHILGDECNSAVRALCEEAIRLPYLCQTLAVFAEISVQLDPTAYCHTNFAVGSREALFCNTLMETLADDPQACVDFADLLNGVMDRLDGDSHHKVTTPWLTLQKVNQFWVMLSLLSLAWFLQPRRMTNKGRHAH